MTTPTPSQAPLSAGAVPELPVVAWKDSWGGYGRWGKSIALTPRDPAQATIHAQAAEIERMKRELAGAYELLHRTEDEKAAIKAKQVAEADEVMRLADVMSQTSGAFGCTLAQHDLVASNAAREALRAFLTKDRT